jgi:hypothetical protein
MAVDFGAAIMIGLVEARERWAMILAMLWLGGILLGAAPYLWALCRAARDEPRPRPADPQPAEPKAYGRRRCRGPASPGPGHRGLGR